MPGDTEEARHREEPYRPARDRDQRAAGAASVGGRANAGVVGPLYRRLAVRYERRADIHEAFLHLGCSLICFNYLS